MLHILMNLGNYTVYLHSIFNFYIILKLQVKIGSIRGKKEPKQFLIIYVLVFELLGT